MIDQPPKHPSRLRRADVAVRTTQVPSRITLGAKVVLTPRTRAPTTEQRGQTGADDEAKTGMAIEQGADSAEIGKDRLSLSRAEFRGARGPAIHIDPSTVTVNIPGTEPVIMPRGIELPVDDAFWRVWNANSMQMRVDGYKLFKIDGKWRAFLMKPGRWHKARGRAG
jgi:hypothetical protein